MAGSKCNSRREMHFNVGRKRHFVASNRRFIVKARLQGAIPSFNVAEK